jgi:phage gp46-like protein
MPAKDELARRRYEKLVDRLESLMRAALKPQYKGYYGQLVLSSSDLEEMGGLKDVRRAAREAGRRLDWKPTSTLVGGRLFVLDKRKVPEEIEQLAEDAAAAAMDRAWREDQ